MPTSPIYDTCNAEDGVLTVKETASLLAISQFTLLRMRQRPNAGGLPYVQLSTNRIGYLRRDVHAFLAARRVGSLPKELENTTARQRRRTALALQEIREESRRREKSP